MENISKFKKLFSKNVEVRFSTCGEIMIDGLPFSFGAESVGKESDKGVCVSISGDAVDSGEVTFSNLEYHEKHGGNITVVKMPLKKIVKKDGKSLYRAEFTKIKLTEYSNGPLFHKVTEDDVLNRMNSEISFRVTPHYSGNDTPEIMLTIYPYENAITGSAVEWLKVTSDKDYFLHKVCSSAERKVH